MADIDVGWQTLQEGTTGYYTTSTYTYIEKTDPANADGTLDEIHFYLKSSVNIAGLKIGTFNPSTKVVRDQVTLGAYSAGGVVNITGVSIDVLTNDLIGSKVTSGTAGIAMTKDRGTGQFYWAGDGFDGGTHSYSSQSHSGSLYATGETVVAGSKALVGGSALVGGQILCGNSPLIN